MVCCYVSFPKKKSLPHFEREDDPTFQPLRCWDFLVQFVFFQVTWRDPLFWERSKNIIFNMLIPQKNCKSSLDSKIDFCDVLMVILCPTGPGGGSSLTTLGSHRSIPALGAPCAAALLPLRLRCRRGRGRRCGRAAALGAGAAAAAQRVAYDESVERRGERWGMWRKSELGW